MRSKDAVKRCKTSVDGSYSGSQSSRASNDDTEWEMPEDETEEEPYNEGPQAVRGRGSGSGRGRGGRGRGKGKSGEASSAPSVDTREEIAKIRESLEFANYYDIITKDTTGMPPRQLKAHMDVVRHLRAKVGMPPPDEDDE